ncbi:MAG TPA: DUF2330 domain-containing protein [Myxococcota bacterium]|jgi:hypothetical protein|nr:DUF2330 domain-containing protein [Myxococcota bacterium]
MTKTRRTGAALAAACAAAVAAGVVAAPATARAFCGFYINGAGATLYNNATLVVLMRDGTRTVLSMRNDYKGPPEDFAMVVPVPVVLKEENVKTLPHAVFERVDKLAAPRLVEYWEEDPCAPRPEYKVGMAGGKGVKMPMGALKKDKDDLGVKIEAEFTVGEYKIVILSAKDSTGLDTWLRREGYKIPAGAEPVLKPYVAAGSKFFVAKVDIKKVKMVEGRARLSPLRFHYDTDEFSLPVRLGLVNSDGTQDLLVHVLARGTRYEVANYDNVTVPTNLDVAEAARGEFGAFYAALLDETMAKNPKAVVTEYSWDASSCDPCPEPALTPEELMTLGADVLPGPAMEKTDPWARTSGFVLTRLHARYTKDSLGEDLILRKAAGIVGGREFLADGKKLEKGSRPSGVNNFQARYAIRHPWTGAIACDKPERGIWGGPPDKPWAKFPPAPALDTAYAPRGSVKLASFVLEDVPELGVKAGAAGPGGGGGGGGAVGGGSGSAGATAASAPASGRPSGDKPAPASADEDEKGCTILKAAARRGAPLPLGLLALCALTVALAGACRRR